MMMAFVTYLAQHGKEGTEGGLVRCSTGLLLPNVEHSKPPPRRVADGYRRLHAACLRRRGSSSASGRLADSGNVAQLGGDAGSHLRLERRGDPVGPLALAAARGMGHVRLDAGGRVVVDEVD